MRGHLDYGQAVTTELANPGQHLLVATQRFIARDRACEGVLRGQATTPDHVHGDALTRGLHFKRDLNWNPWIAAALSLIPGLGQIYKGERLYALIWFVGVLIAYTAGPVGLLLHVVCIANAALAGAIEFPPRLSASSAGRVDGLNRQ